MTTPNDLPSVGTEDARPVCDDAHQHMALVTLYALALMTDGPTGAVDQYKALNASVRSLVSERDSLHTAYKQVRLDCHNLTEKVIPNIRAERDELASRVRELEGALWGCIAAIERTHHCTEADRLAAADKARRPLCHNT